MFKSRGNMTKLSSKYIKSIPKNLLFVYFIISVLSPKDMEGPRCIAHLETLAYCPLT